MPWDNQAFGNYIAGLTDGEGSFYIAYKKHKYSKFGYQLYPTFQIDLVYTNADLLKQIRDFIGVGHVYIYSHSYGNRQRKCRYIVNGHETRILIPFFETFKLYIKRADFEKWKSAVLLFCKGGRRGGRRSWSKRDFEKMKAIKQSFGVR